MMNNCEDMQKVIKSMKSVFENIIEKLEEIIGVSK